MKRIITIILLLSIYPSCNDNPAEPSPLYGKLEGIVYQVNTNTPIAGVVITIGNISFTTSSDGKFLLENIPSGEGTLNASKSDYETYQQTVKIEANKTTNITIYLTPSIALTTVSGVVRDDETERPISGAKVIIAEQIDYTDAGGRYQLPNVPQGTHKITAEKGGYLKFEGQLFLSSANREFDINLLKGTLIIDGLLKKDTTFTRSNSPYYVNTDIIIGVDATLIIESGVILKVASGKKIKINSHSDFNRDGKLIAKGTQQHPIIFTSQRDIPQQSDWEGIEYNGASPYPLTNKVSEIEYAIIEYARYGIYARQRRITISNTIIQYCYYGINAPVSLANSIVRNNNIGIYQPYTYIRDYQQPAEGWINNVLVENSGSHGIQLDRDGAHNVRIFNSTIKNNGGIGVLVPNGYYRYNDVILPRTTIRNSIIEGNQSSGISFNGGLIDISNNNFISNKFHAFRRTSSVFSRNSNDINNNYIAGNNGKPISEVDMSIDGSGGQYTTNKSMTGSTSIGNPRSSENLGIGVSWQGFPK